MILRPATLADAEILLAWRNDPVTRANSHHETPVMPLDHRAWLQRALESPAIRLYVAEANGTRIGSGRLDLFEFGVTATLSLTVAPAHRGCGYSPQIIQGLRDEAERLGVKVLTATVLPHNIPSLRAFLSAGFVPVGPVDFVPSRSPVSLDRAPM